jgi:hypothetical protein
LFPSPDKIRRQIDRDAHALYLEETAAAAAAAALPLRRAV